MGGHFPEASLIEPDGPDLPYFILADVYALKTSLVKPYSWYDSQIHNPQGQEGAILSLRFSHVGTPWQDIVLACVVLHNMLRAERGAGGRAERDLEDEELPCDLEDADSGETRLAATTWRSGLMVLVQCHGKMARCDWCRQQVKALFRTELPTW